MEDGRTAKKPSEGPLILMHLNISVNLRMVVGCWKFFSYSSIDYRKETSLYSHIYNNSYSNR